MQSMELPVWVEYFKVVGAPVASLIASLVTAVIAGFVAFKIGKMQAAISRDQATIARNKLKLELYDQRLAVFQVLRETIGIAIRNGRLTSDEENNYIVGIAGSAWLFDDEVHDYLYKKFWPMLVNLYAANAALDDRDPTQDRAAVAKQRADAFREIVEQLHIIEELFKPFLRIET